MSIRTQPEDSAVALLRTVIAADIRTDPFLVDLMLKFAALHRNVSTGEWLETCLTPVEKFVKECLFLERDAFDRFRFDVHGDNRHILHCIKLADITKTPRDFAALLDPVLQQYDIFCLQSTLVHQGRWMEHRLSCAEEVHRVDSRLPLVETVEVPADSESLVRIDGSFGVARRESEGSPLVLFVRYSDPILPTPQGDDAGKGS
ncbi:hypothetical protein TraAM80_04806 [Trypanosoma rangeli]|uniref:Uncharacterized protein n=1 Tax=Trypanosoma rangeli TaxID=5698 RepID=A0A3R7MM05_TRYRA|nr:uncharacterized protein TraAM80_04806 [Trypanosoma rangeli]RNF04953.1 hypothetical protein TraAM80_04806 [Trypanosoma rangeli]|eukprot:RNF04953.1 hypothetical protein TraAM80_04806 [Trypanosoma rangeli]